MKGETFADVVIVRAPSDEGLELARQLETLVAGRGFTSVTAPSDLRPVAFALSVYGSKIVIVDLSLENDRDDVHRTFGVHAASTDHLLVVSRTPLPVNVVPMRQGGAPPYAPEGVDPARWNNRNIVQWVAKQLEDPSLPEGPRVTDEEAIGITRNEPEEYLQKIKSMQRRSIDRRKEGGIFISYRGRDWEIARALAARIESGAWPGLPSRVQLFAPGALALDRELLTGLRRWMVVGQLDDALRSASEVWIVDTPAYRGSWWTIAELVMAAYIDEPGNDPPRVRIYDPAADRLFEPTGDWRVSMPLDVRLELAHLLANSRADLLSVEAAERLRGTRAVYGTDFWETLTIEPAHLDGSEPEYALDARTWLATRDAMVRFAREEVERAHAEDRSARSIDGTREVRIAQAAPRHFWVAPTRGVPNPGAPCPSYMDRER